MTHPEQLTDQLSNWLNSVNTAAIPRDRKRDMVVFLDRVVEVVEQAFRDVFRICIELKYIREDLSVAGITRLRKELDSLRARDKYRDVEFICGRLHVLRKQYHDSGFDEFTRYMGSDFQQLTYLIDDREGEIVRIAAEFLGMSDRSLQTLLESANGGQVDHGLADTIAEDAQTHSATLARILADLNALHTRILGSVDAGGLLDLFLKDETALQVQVDSRQYHVGGDYVGGNQTKGGRDVIQAGRDVVTGAPEDPNSLEDARAVLLAELNDLPNERRAALAKQIDSLVDDIQRRITHSAIHEKATAIEMMLESGQTLFGGVARTAWQFIKRYAGRP